MRKTIAALAIATVAIHFASFAVDSLKSTMQAHVAQVDRAASNR
jgi:hypothetical protein